MFVFESTSRLLSTNTPATLELSIGSACTDEALAGGSVCGKK